MNSKEIKELIEFLIEKDVAEFELERGDVKMRMKRGSSAAPVAALAPAYVPAQALALAAAPVAAAPVTTGAAAVEPAESESEEAGLHVVRSPIVGTFYESPSPGAAPFVKPGDTVQAGQPLGIIEAMKLMNEIESDVSGVVVKRHVENGQPVEYGAPLFSIRPS